MKKAIFTLGLPGSGKSTFLKEKYDLPNSNYVSADEIRINHKDYNPNHPELLHELCVKLAEEKIYSFADKDVETIIMDGGGINNNYTRRIIDNLKKQDYYVEVYYINTPVSICVSRNKERFLNGERFVPIEVVIEKSYKLIDSVNRLKELSNYFEEVRYFSDKNIFVDMDGVVAEYQELPIDENGDINFVSHNIFINARPVYEIIQKLKRFSNQKINLYILSASPNSVCSQQKREWIKNWMPFISDKDIYFVGNKDFKHLMLKDLILHLKLERKDCTLIDDDHFILDKVNALGIRAIHPSKFLANF